MQSGRAKSGVRVEVAWLANTSRSDAVRLSKIQAVVVLAAPTIVARALTAVACTHLPVLSHTDAGSVFRHIGAATLLMAVLRAPRPIRADIRIVTRHAGKLRGFFAAHGGVVAIQLIRNDSLVAAPLSGRALLSKGCRHGASAVRGAILVRVTVGIRLACGA